MTLALELGDLPGQAFASACGLATLFLLRSEAAALQEAVQLCQRMREEHGLGPWQHLADALLVWLMVMRGKLQLARDGLTAVGEALACFQQAFELARKRACSAGSCGRP